MEVSINGVTQNCWLVREIPTKMDDLRVPPFMETPIFDRHRTSVCFWGLSSQLISVVAQTHNELRQSPIKASCPYLGQQAARQQQDSPNTVEDTWLARDV